MFVHVLCACVWPMYLYKWCRSACVCLCVCAPVCMRACVRTCMGTCVCVYHLKSDSERRLIQGTEVA